MEKNGFTFVHYTMIPGEGFLMTDTDFFESKSSLSTMCLAVMSSAGVKKKITKTIWADLSFVVLVLVNKFVRSRHEWKWNKVKKIRNIK